METSISHALLLKFSSNTVTVPKRAACKHVKAPLEPDWGLLLHLG